VDDDNIDIVPQDNNEISVIKATPYLSNFSFKPSVMSTAERNMGSSRRENSEFLN